MLTPTSKLVLWGMGTPPYSVRGLSEVLTPIGQAVQLRRTVNGVLKDVSSERFRKYAVSISCTDQQPPSLDYRWPGFEVTVDCVSELAYHSYDSGPAKTPVPGSERTESGFMFYRPRLTCLVRNFSMTTDAYGASIQWSLDLEEMGTP